MLAPHHLSLSILLYLAQHSKMEEWALQMRGVCVEILGLNNTKQNTLKEK